MNRGATLLLMLLLAMPAHAMQSPVGVREFGEVARLTGDEARGAALFGTTCTNCHGRDGGGSPDGNTPAIAGQHLRVIARQLVDYRHADRWDVRMEEVAGSHMLRDVRDIADLAAHVSRLAAAQAPGHGDGHAVDRGREQYLRACAGCHGAEAEGNGVLLVPRLASQHYRYLLRQFHDTVDGRRPNMPPPHPQLFGEWSVEDFTAVADYLSRLPARRLAR